MRNEGPKFARDARTQLMLITVVKEAPCRKAQLLTTLGVTWSESMDTLARAKLIEIDRAGVVRLAQSMPADLTKFLHALAETPTGAQSKRRERIPPESYALIFGSDLRLGILMSLEREEGASDTARISASLKLDPALVRKTVRSMVANGILEYVESPVGGAKRFHYKEGASWVAPMRAVLRRLLRRSKLTATPGVNKIEPYKKAGKIDWTDVPATMRKPVGFVPSADRAPLLFGTHARLRALAFLACNGSSTTREWERGARIRADRTAPLLMDLGLIRREKDLRGYRYAIDANSAIHDALVALLRALAARFFPGYRRTTLRSHTGSVDPDVTRIFGTPARTYPVLLLGALPYVDVSSAQRLLRNHDRGEIRRTFAMLKRYKIAESFREGNAVCYRLNRRWFAYEPLRTLLTALLASERQLLVEVGAETSLMGPKRLVMRENGARARA